MLSLAAKFKTCVLQLLDLEVINSITIDLIFFSTGVKVLTYRAS